MSPNVFKGLMECCRLIPAACLINKNLQFVCKCNLGLISSAHLHLEKNNKLKFNVAIRRVYGDCGEEGGRGAAGLMRGLSEGSGPTRTSPVQEWPDAQQSPQLADFTTTWMPPCQRLLVQIRKSFSSEQLLICVYYSQRLMDFYHAVIVKLKWT